MRAKSALSSQAPAARSAGDCHSAALAAVRPATLLGPSPLASSNATATRRTRHGNAISAARLLAGALWPAGQGVRDDHGAAAEPDPQPGHVRQDADLTEITLAMADYNLLVLPVLDSEDRLLGVLTIGEILEAAITPEQRRMRA